MKIVYAPLLLSSAFLWGRGGRICQGTFGGNSMQKFILRKVRVHDVNFGEKTEVVGHILLINREKLIQYLLEDRHLRSIDVKIARPGEKKRIIPIKDILEPRAKLGETYTTLPGFLGTADQGGTGITCCLDRVAVVTSGKLVNFQEGLIDMTGPGAEFTLFSKSLNVVLLIEPTEGLGKHEHEKTVREAGVKAAHYLGLAATQATFDEEIHYPIIS